MRTIHKYVIPVDYDSVVQMPKGAAILKIAMQNGALCAWAFVDTEAEMEKRHFKIVGTGHPLSDDFHIAWGIDDGNYNYVDTVFDRQFVWHVFANL